jgi:hypothetical protein
MVIGKNPELSRKTSIYILIPIFCITALHRCKKEEENIKGKENIFSGEK